MKLALLSDIHANLHALQACLDHAQAQGVDQWVFLGDLVGYGANPSEKWQLYDLSGRTIETQFVPEGNGVRFSMVNASPGTYLVRSQFRSTLVIKN